MFVIPLKFLKLSQQKNLVWHASEQKVNIDVFTSEYVELLDYLGDPMD